MGKRTEAAEVGPALTKAQAGEYLGISERGVERLIAGRKLRSVKIGQLRRLLRTDLDRYLTENNRLER